MTVLRCLSPMGVLPTRCFMVSVIVISIRFIQLKASSEFQFHLGKTEIYSFPLLLFFPGFGNLKCLLILLEWNI